jgi:hypothetical protein
LFFITYPREPRCGLLRGPGLEYPDMVAYHPNRVLGTYEMQLNEIVEKEVARRPELIIDVGGADGYYICGMLYRLANSRVIAFEAIEEERKKALDLAELNGLESRLEMHGYCDIENLKLALSGSHGSFLIVDIEGGEKALLDPVRVPDLLHTHILCEVYEYFDGEIPTVLRRRFESTHSIEVIGHFDKERCNLPFALSTVEQLFFKKYYDIALGEGRGYMEWFYMVSLNKEAK